MSPRAEVARDEEDVDLQGHKVFVVKKGHDVILEAVTDERPVTRLTFRLGRDEAHEIAVMLLEATVPDVPPKMVLGDYGDPVCRCKCVTNHPSETPICVSVHLPGQEVCVPCVAATERERRQ